MLWYPKGQKLKLLSNCDGDFAGCQVELKSTSGSCLFVDSCWNSKKQNSIALSIAKVEYKASGFSMAQILWINNQHEDYEINLKQIPI